MVGAGKVVASRPGAAEVDRREMGVGVGGPGEWGAGGKCTESIICNNKRIYKIKMAQIG